MLSPGQHPGPLQLKLHWLKQTQMYRKKNVHKKDHHLYEPTLTEDYKYECIALTSHSKLFTVTRIHIQDCHAWRSAIVSLPIWR